MFENLPFVYYLLLSFVLIIIIFIFLILINKYKLNHNNLMLSRARDYIINYFSYDYPNIKFKKTKYLVEQYISMKQALLLNEETSDLIEEYFIKKNLINKAIKNLKNKNTYAKNKAYKLLGYIKEHDIVFYLENALKEEFNNENILYLVNALCEQKKHTSIPIIINKIYESTGLIKEKLIALVTEFEKDLEEYIFNNEIKDKTDNTSRTIIVCLSSTYTSQNLKDYLHNQILNYSDSISLEAAIVIKNKYPEILNNNVFINHKNIELRKIAISSLVSSNNNYELDKLFNLLDDKDCSSTVITSISQLISERPQLTNLIIQNYYNEENQIIKSNLAEILSNKIEYLLIRITGQNKNEIKEIISRIITEGKLSNIIGFLNRNKNREIENEIISIFRPLLNNEKIKTDLELYLDERILKKLDLTKKIIERVKREEKIEKDKIKLLIIILISLIITFPIVYYARRHSLFEDLTWLELLKIYIIDFNYYLVFYSTAVNLSYIILLWLSFKGVKKQFNQWKSKSESFLFKKKILPSVSIIAPAYCEEFNIIESSNSLLNLKYPDYELIVVNDGSGDNTLNVLIDYYNLEKVDIHIDEKINTMPIRGIYKNKNIPRLTVVDKANGGKADSLNAGINVSKNEYFCGIDADSLLEADALMKIASLTIDSQDESVALGGNIFPINGCVVDKGKLESINLPKNKLALFQFIEYLRAFMCGRIGWANINSLLIISGAFGLFKKNRVIEIGGYLTSSGKLKKDTVGEDMELVVRLSRHMQELKLPYSVHYSFNANCWTEVPEDFKILKNQRDRWHRGLIDILSFHRKVIFNKNYGRMGKLAMPYFLIFETIGPLIEFKGYAMVLLAGILGLLNVEIAILLFISSILMGIIISLSSILIGEKELQYFSTKEVFKLMWIAIIENFGFRQLVSFWRVTGFASSLKKPKGWGKMTRKGFASKA